MKKSLFLMAFAVVAIAAQAYSGRYYNVTANAQGNGKVYVSRSSSTPAESDYQTSYSTGNVGEATAETSLDFYFFALPDDGYKFQGWYDGNDDLVSAVGETPFVKSLDVRQSSDSYYVPMTLVGKFVPEYYGDKYFLAQAATDGGGKVYVGMVEPSDEDYKDSQATCEYSVYSENESDVVTFYYYAQAAENHEFDGWYDANGMKVSDANPMAADLTSSSLDPDAPAVLSYVAQFVDVSTGVNDIAAGEVASVKYVDLNGRVTSEPQPGVNIEVTTLTDGRRVTRKIVK